MQDTTNMEDGHQLINFRRHVQLPFWAEHVVFCLEANVMAVSSSEEIHLLNTRTGDTLGVLQHPSTVWKSCSGHVEGHVFEVICCSTSSGELFFWCLENKQLLLQIKIHDECIFGCDWHPSRPLVVTVSADGHLQISLVHKKYDVLRCHKIIQFQCHALSAEDVKFSHNGQWLATCSKDKLVKVWDVEELLEMGNSLDFEDDSDDVWSEQTNEMQSSNSDEVIPSLTDIHDRDNDNNLTSINSKEKLMLQANITETHAVTDENDNTSVSRYIGASGKNGLSKSIVQCESCVANASISSVDCAQTNKPSSQLESHEEDETELFFGNLSFSSLSTESSGSFDELDYTFNYLNPPNYDEQPCLTTIEETRSSTQSNTTGKSSVEDVCRAAESQTTLSAMTPPPVVLPKHQLKGHQHWVFCVEFNRSDQLLGSVSSDKTVRLWLPRRGTLFKVLRGHTNIVWQLCFFHMPNKEYLASCSSDKTVRCWDMDTLTEVECHSNLGGDREGTGQILCCAHNHHANTLVVGMYSGAVWWSQVKPTEVACS